MNTGTADAGMPAGATSPFEAFGVPAYVTKVKTMLTGLAPTQAEIDQVMANAGALSDLGDHLDDAPGVRGEDGGLLR